MQDRGGNFIQFLPPLKVLVVIEEIIPALAPGAVIYTAILTRLGRVRLADRSWERFGYEVLILGCYRRWRVSSRSRFIGFLFRR